MKTEQEIEIIERLLPHIAAAFNEADNKLNCVMLYDNAAESVLIQCDNISQNLEVNVCGDSPVAVIFDVIKQFYCKMI